MGWLFTEVGSVIIAFIVVGLIVVGDADDPFDSDDELDWR